MTFPTITVLDASGTKQTVNTTPAAGQLTMANSLPVVIASDQSAIPITGTITATTSGTATTAAPTYTTGTSNPLSLNLEGGLRVDGSGVVQPVSQSGNWTVGGALLTPTASFTTTAVTTAWTSNQLIANSATAGSVVPLTFTNAVRVNGGSGSIRRAQIQVASDTGFAGQSLVLALYTSAPTFANGDRATWLTTDSGYIGSIAVTLSQHFSDYEQGIGVPVNGSEINFACAGGTTTLYGAIISPGTITPQAGSKAINVSLEVLAN